MKRHLRMAAIMVMGVQAASSSATVAFSNFGPGYAYEITGGWTVSGPTSGFPTQVVAFQFTAQASGALSSVIIPMGHVAGTNVGQVLLYKDSGSNTIGDTLIQWTQALEPLGGPDLLNLSYPDDLPVLVAGTKYWLGTHYVADDAWNAWNITTVPDAQYSAFSYNGGDSYVYSMQMPAGAFEVHVVPEPSAMAALGLGLVAIARRQMKK